MNWRKQTTAARFAGTFFVAAAEPGGERFMALKQVADPMLQNQLWLLAPDGSSRLIAPEAEVAGPSLQT